MNNQEIVERIALHIAQVDVHMFSLILQDKKQLLPDASFRKLFDAMLQSSPIGQYIIEYTDSSNHEYKEMILEDVIDYIQDDKDYLLYKVQKEVQKKIGSLDMELNYYYTRQYVTEQPPAYVTEVDRLEKMSLLTHELLQLNHQLLKYQLILGEWKTPINQGFIYQKTVGSFLAEQELMEDNPDESEHAKTNAGNTKQHENIREHENTRQRENTKLYEFRRKLVGGYIMGAAYDGGNVFVNELTVMKLRLENGDKLAVKARPSGQDYMYDYHIVEKSKNPETDRVQIDNCLAEKIDGQFCVRKQYTDSGVAPINIGHGITVLYLGEQDVTNKQIQEGDLINIAFYIGNPEHVRVLWKHPHH